MIELSLGELLLTAVSVAGGAFLGGTVRGVLRHLPGGLTGTLAANLSACLILGAVFGLGLTGHQLWQLALGTGFCGGLSTWSTLAGEFGGLLRQRALRTAAGYFTATVGGGLASAWLGWTLTGLL